MGVLAADSPEDFWDHEATLAAAASQALGARSVTILFALAVAEGDQPEDALSAQVLLEAAAKVVAQEIEKRLPGDPREWRPPVAAFCVAILRCDSQSVAGPELLRSNLTRACTW